MRKLKSVLLVDDDNITNFLNKFFVQRVAPSVEINVVLNGKEAIDFLALNGKDTMPCLLILDTNMPVMDGWEFLETFNKKFDADFRKKVVIVMMTSLDVEQAEKQAMKDPNVTDTGQKPLSDLKFHALINKHF